MVLKFEVTPDPDFQVPSGAEFPVHSEDDFIRLEDNFQFTRTSDDLTFERTP